jgi:hypothetical protein
MAMTVERKSQLRGQLKGIEANGGAESAIAAIVREVLEEVGPTSHAEAVDDARRAGGVRPENNPATDQG